MSLRDGLDASGRKGKVSFFNIFTTACPFHVTFFQTCKFYFDYGCPGQLAA